MRAKAPSQQSTAPTTLDPDKGSPLSSSEHQHTADSEPITRDNRGPVTLLKAELGIQALQGPLQANRPVVLEYSALQDACRPPALLLNPYLAQAASPFAI
ncbi:hypothetical protein PtB15_4B436 [Puccinia triticina]|nr:hypothetical protein PtB15_4B436 [Puccinia triticina]